MRWSGTLTRSGASRVTGIANPRHFRSGALRVMVTEDGTYRLVPDPPSLTSLMSEYGFDTSGR